MISAGLKYSTRSYSVDESRYVVNPKNQMVFEVSELVMDVIRLVQKNGQLDTVIAEVAEKHAMNPDEATMLVWDAVHVLRDAGMLELSLTPIASRPLRDTEKKLSVGRALLSITHRCNFRCRHCLQGTDSPFNELDTMAWSRIIRNLSDEGLSHIFVTGGEPLLRADAANIVTEAADYQFPVRLFTNGLLVNSDLVNQLKKIDSLVVQVSLHGIDSRGFDPFVGVDGAFDRVIDSIRLLTSSGIRVSVATSFRDELVPKMDHFPTLLQELGVTEWIPTMIMPLGCAYDGWKGLRMSNENLREFMDSLFRYLSMYKGNDDFTISSPFDISMLQSTSDDWGFSDLSFGCSLYRQYINVQPDGTVTPCDRLTNYVLGSLRDTPLSELLSKKDLMQCHIQDVQSRLDSIGARKRCNECNYRHLCGRGCPGILFHGRNLGEQYDDPVVCRMFNECFDIVMKYASPQSGRKLLSMTKKMD